MPIKQQMMRDAIGSTRSTTLPFAPAAFVSSTSVVCGNVKMSPFFAFFSYFSIGPYSILRTVSVIIMTSVKSA